MWRISSSRAPGVHEGKGLIHERVEQVGGVGQGPEDPLGADDGEPVTREEHLRPELRHLPQGHSPLAGVPLDLLGVAGVGGGPDEEVTAAQDLLVGHPGPGVVVGLPPGVVEIEGQPSDLERQTVAVRPVRVAVRRRPPQPRYPELTLVDDLVVARREDVAIETRR